VDAPSDARKFRNGGARSRVLTSVRPWLRPLSCRGPVGRGGVAALIHVADAAVGVFCDLEFGAQFVEKATLPSKGQILLVNSEYGNPRSPHSYSHRIGTTADCHDLQRLGPLSDLTSAFPAQSNRTSSWATMPPLVRVGLHSLCFENAMPRPGNTRSFASRFRLSHIRRGPGSRLDYRSASTGSAASATSASASRRVASAHPAATAGVTCGPAGRAGRATRRLCKGSTNRSKGEDGA
jgi:hypothetical protein